LAGGQDIYHNSNSDAVRSTTEVLRTAFCVCPLSAVL